MLTVADTAFSIAVVRAEETERPPSERLFEDPYAHVFSAAGAHAVEGTARFLALPFFRDGIRLRTRFIDDVVREGLASGLRQIVLLGAGFDSRALRLSEIAEAGATVFEVDFDAQLRKKRDLLEAAGVTLPAYLHHVACDFTLPDFEDTLTVGLEAQGFGRGEGALFVWEGVVSYIGIVAVERSLRFMVDVGGRGSRVVFEFGAGFFDPGGVAELTGRAGFTACEELGLDTLWRRYLSGTPHEVASICRIATATV